MWWGLRVTFSSLGMNFSLMGSWTRQLVVLHPSQGKGGQRLLSAQPPASVDSELRRVCLSEGEGERGGRGGGTRRLCLVPRGRLGGSVEAACGGCGTGS